jgi:hypothetical protein
MRRFFFNKVCINNKAKSLVKYSINKEYSKFTNFYNKILCQ